MTDLAFHASAARSHAETRSWESRRLLLLYAVVVAALAVGAASVWAARHDAAGMEAPLVVLLRFMAGMKALMAFGAVALTHWRLRTAAPATLVFGYVASLGLMTVAPGLIFSLAHIALGAALFHVGLLVFLLIAWRDDGVSLPSRAIRLAPPRS